MRLELVYERTDLALATDDMDSIGELESRLQNLESHHLRERVGQADVQTQRALPRPLPNRVHQLAPGRENLIRVAEHQVSLFGENEVASAAPEKLIVERLLEELELRADGRLRDVQFFGGFPHAASFGDHPEVAEVMKIEEFHAETYIAKSYRSNRI